MNDKLQEYAKLLIRVGLNIQKGQNLVISAPVECAFFARVCAEKAYEAGCREVVMNWTDDALSRMKYLHAREEVFDHVPLWRRHFFNDYALEGAAYLAISATDPESLKGVESDRIVRAQRSSGKALREFNRLQMCSGFPWCIASIPIPSWAKTVFPEDGEERAMEKLWEAIFSAVRISGDGTSVERWEKHLATLAERKERLNALRFRSLHYTNSLGTDLTVELPEGHVWESGDDRLLSGRSFVANMPTEEIFTSPLRTGVNGVVYSALPLVHDGNIIDQFHFVVKEGKIVEAHAEKGEETLKAAISVDEGASYFGEVALVPYDSPISNQKILFYNTLFDENAACHIAFGEAYPCIERGREMGKEELKERGLNESITHVDFMVGTPDLSIVGTTHDGREVPVFENGNFAQGI
ncbi:aminopeptidase [Oscillibacter sp. MSJ-2]|uniref:Aminopeptidase n=1 Tax=Dysosmobacter acutus TaxID=2841504 RepID=A0ABS6F868_9FIRM|nr:aminopeptidase [Dysosmobacter acutus]MBU5626475.1 aminopeptidase [Dysosmobacter acutus]